MTIAPPLLLPEVPALVAGLGTVAAAFPDGTLETLDVPQAGRIAKSMKPMVVHRLNMAARLKIDAFTAHDLLELFAFVRPATSCLPSPEGLCLALGLSKPKDRLDAALALPEIATRLLSELRQLSPRAHAVALGCAVAMTKGGWPWGPSVLAALGHEGDLPHRANTLAGLKVWERLGEWSEHAPPPPPGSMPVDAEAARKRLAQLLGQGAEDRPQQADYASAAALAFQPRKMQDAPNAVLAEAGTGTGKTLGYVAPASVWAEINEGAVWISTFTRHLQRQIDGELDRLYPDADEKARRVVVRKGRENYLCLLNLEEAVMGLPAHPDDAIALGLMARWVLATRDGDLVGGDFPGWLADLVGRSRTLGLADRRGECIFSSCSHITRCFVERSIRKARRARIVIANHALVMVQSSLGNIGDDGLVQRLIFDEGHHLFDAADGAFSAHLSGLETYELRRWLLGAEDGARSRARGLKKRVEDLAENSQEAIDALQAALQAAQHLPGYGWAKRLKDRAPYGAAERFLDLVRGQVLARADQHSYTLECDTLPLNEGLAQAAATLAVALERMARPLAQLVKIFAKKLSDEAKDLDSNSRQRIDSLIRSIERRALVPLHAWGRMLAEIEAGGGDLSVDWMTIEQIDGREIDVGLNRAFIDPTKPFAEQVMMPAHGVLITSATLTDSTGEAQTDWQSAEQRTGTLHLPLPALRAAHPSPYNYADQARVFIVTDVRKDDLDQVAAAYRELFIAAGGGALGLFTAITRLKGVHGRIAKPLDEAGLPLLAQHVDGLDNATLVDLFRAEEDACLLGTDAMRDGVDVPGRALRLLVFDRVPWPRPDIVHRARRKAFGGKQYDDMLTRFKLKQAFGRLIRKETDHGVFVLLDPMMPSRLFGAFPDGVIPRRVGLAETVAEIREFLLSPPPRRQLS
ncbi:DinG family ATP-dependent helicase YoaA [Rhodospirillaceae bacterium LM-1]|nr:DinG family ATP-dependent helicase YoaA [Rhodospirillaceae bacterium LM-1]